jgi:stress-induced-phosphoprotein 1
VHAGSIPCCRPPIPAVFRPRAATAAGATLAPVTRSPTLPHPKKTTTTKQQAQGNAAFTAGDYPTARDLFSKALELDPNNHVLYSNRSAALASLRLYRDALSDAEKCVSLKKDWPKGYSRLGAALHGLGKYNEAVEALEEGLRLDPGSAQLQAALSEAVSARNRAAAGGGEGGAGGESGGEGLASLFGADGLARLALDPRTRDLADDEGFRASLARVRADPSQLGQMMDDEKMQRALEVLLGVRIGRGGPGGGFGGGPGGDAGPMATDEEHEASSTAAAAARKRREEEAKAKAEAEAKAKADAEAKAKAEAEAAKAEAEAAMSPEEKAAAADRARRLAEAGEHKAAGAKAYASRDFAAAIDHFTKAVELAGDQDVSFLLNRAAAKYEASDYEGCVADCDEAVAKGRELRADFALVSKALTRRGNALLKLDRLEEAVETYGKALTEHRSADTLKKLQEAERMLRQRREDAYVDLALSEQERQLGNADFKAGRYPEAVSRYAEALRRGPAGRNPEAHKLYSNLSAAYFKLGALQDADKAAQRCIDLDPSFSKGWSRKGAVEFLRRDYDQAMATYREGLEALERAAREKAKASGGGGGEGGEGEGDAANAPPLHLEGADELREGLMKCAAALNRLAHGMGSKEELEERRMKAMSDPKIRNLLNEPAVVAALDAMQHDPRAAERYLSDPVMRDKITRLVSAGIITMG